MAFDRLILGGQLVTGSRIEQADIGILNGKIAEIGDLAHASAAETIRADNLHVLPGVIDTQVHFREPGLEHKEDLESGTRAALMGGVTSILEMPNTQPNTVDSTTFEDKLNRARGRAWCHYGFFIGANTENADHLAELENLPGCPGIKIFMGSSTGTLLVSEDDDLRRVLRSGKRRCPIHAEDEPRNRSRKSLISADPHPREHPYLRDAESAILATRRILALSKETGRPIHILHISTGDEPEIIAEAKRSRINVTSEVTPQHLFFSAPDCYERLGTLAQMNPPIRDHSHTERIWAALQAGMFDVFGSDHAPHTLEEKSQPYPASPSGMPGVQTLLPVLLTFAGEAKISLNTIVKMTAERPAELYGIRNKGRIEVGYDADLVLVDTKKQWEFSRSHVESKCGWSPYEGVTFTGSIDHVLLNGEVAVYHGTRSGQPSGSMLDFSSTPS